MALERRIGPLEAQSGADDDEVVEWGPGHEHLPTMTKRELKKMLNDMHDRGSGRLLVRPATMTNGAANISVIR